MGPTSEAGRPDKPGTIAPRAALTIGGTGRRRDSHPAASGFRRIPADSGGKPAGHDDL